MQYPHSCCYAVASPLLPCCILTPVAMQYLQPCCRAPREPVAAVRTAADGVQPRIGAGLVGATHHHTPHQCYHYRRQARGYSVTAPRCAPATPPHQNVAPQARYTQVRTATISLHPSPISPSSSALYIYFYINN